MIRRALPFVGMLASTMAQAPEQTTVQLPEHVVLTGTLSTDVDADGRDDLVLACRDTKAKKRELRVHLRRGEAPVFANEPSRPPYAVDSDVIAFTFADYTAAKGRELVLLTADRAVAVEFGGDGTPTYVPLFTNDLVWPTADPDFVLPLPNARCDLNGDGREDLLLPQTWGAIANLQNPPGMPRDGKLANWTYCILPEWRSPVAGTGRGPASFQGGELRLGLQLGGGGDDERDTGPLVRVRTRTPPCLVADVDGNGHLDLAAVRNGRAFFVMKSAGPAVDTRDVALPLPEDRLALFDPAFDVQLVDTNGDKRLDLVLTTSASRDDEIEVRIDLFVTRDDGTWADKPSSRLRMKTLAKAPQLVDADGDGRLDVVAVTVRTDTLRGLTSGTPTALDAQLNVFRGTGDRFALPALLIAPLQLPAKSQRGGGTFVEVLGAANGNPAALLLREGDALQRRPLQPDGERLRLGEPSTTLPIPDKSQLELLRSGEVLVRTDHELLHVRTR